MKTLAFSLSLCALFVTACASIKPHYAQPAEFIKPLQTLSSSVDAQLHNPYTTNRPSGQALLQAAMNGKSDLQEAFQNVPLLITNQSDKAIILMLNPAKTNLVWFEDATWTPLVDKYWFLSNAPVRFTIPFP